MRITKPNRCYLQCTDVVSFQGKLPMVIDVQGLKSLKS